MNKVYQSGRLILECENPLTEKKSRISMPDLVEEASSEDVMTVKTALDAVVNDPIQSTKAVMTYEYQ